MQLLPLDLTRAKVLQLLQSIRLCGEI